MGPAETQPDMNVRPIPLDEFTIPEFLRRT